MTSEENKIEMKRIVFRTTDYNSEKLEKMAYRYGMSVNSLVGFIVGQWLDNNYDANEKMRDKMVDNMMTEEVLTKVMGQMFNNPVGTAAMKDSFQLGVETAMKQLNLTQGDQQG